VGVKYLQVIELHNVAVGQCGIASMLFVY